MAVLHLAANSGLSDFEQKALVALVSAIIGASATLLVHFLKARAEPRKKISWESSTDPGFAAIDDQEIQDKLRVSYDDVAVNNIFAIRYKVTNTGNRVIKHQQVRFSFPEGSQILESYLSPTPARELKVEKESQGSDREVIYEIGQLERNQEVQFKFVAAGESADQWEAVPSNEEGDVEVEKRGSTQKREDRAHIGPFLIALFLFITVPYAVESPFIDEPIGDALTTIARFTFLGYALFHLAPVTRIARDAVTKRESSGNDREIHAHAHGDGTVVVVAESGQIQGNVEVHRPAEGTTTNSQVS
jgi:hypothetical protein